MRFKSLLLALALAPAAAWSYQPDLTGLDTVPLQALDAQATARAVAVAQAIPGRVPFVFAARVPLQLGRDAGQWRDDAQTASWRLRVHSSDARSLVLEFGSLALPAGGELWIYDPAGHVVQGPYTQAPAEGLWTALVPGDTVVIEARVPAAARGSMDLHLAEVAHGFRDTSSGSMAKSGSCNRDVVCSEGDEWRNEIRATARLQIPLPDALGLCTGTLVNNIRQDDRPFVLTADHCHIGEEGSPASGVVTYWNYETSSCGGAPDGSLSQSQSGATLRADDATTDFTLIELAVAPQAAFHVHFAGWDASGAGASTGASVHHPSGDEKRISVFTTPVTRSEVNIGKGPIPAWRVDHWDVGTTEPGSSGSGLWNQDHRIIGSLSGGGASCTADPSNDNDASDFYARMESGWEARPVPEGQLRAWLDPDNTASKGVAGRDPGGEPAAVDPPSSFGAAPGEPVVVAEDRSAFGGAFGGALGLGTLGLLAFGFVTRKK
ncbi:MAG TPA: trypsin-like peptidase domain-containing protein [Solimonas sp.]|nr:trypsin-like peptidase domain-containing protein [Solimonas sp.]